MIEAADYGEAVEIARTCPHLGEGTWIGAFTLIDGLGDLKIGKGCNISCGAQILSHSTVRRCLTARRHEAIDRGSTEVGDYVFVGANAVVQMGARIGDHCVIAAGAVVRTITTRHARSNLAALLEG